MNRMKSEGATPEGERRESAMPQLRLFMENVMTPFKMAQLKIDEQYDSMLKVPYKFEGIHSLVSSLSHQQMGIICYLSKYSYFCSQGMESEYTSRRKAKVQEHQKAFHALLEVC